MTELGFLERKKKERFLFLRITTLLLLQLDSPLLIYSVYPWGLKFSFSFLGVGSIGNVFFNEKCVAKFQSNHPFSSQIKFYWKGHLFSISENIFGVFFVSNWFLVKNTNQY